ncbi:MAG: RnfABCDGE type electron transport complex subunit D [Phycisphaerales bacterium]|nr:RnfABCDGE type electron transport complex subunit D [Phycisphaerales bacterium]
MTPRDPHLLLQAAPFLRRGITTPRLMTEVVIGLGPVVLAACYYFGLSALLVLAATSAGAVAAEVALGSARPRGASIRDGSAILTGLVLGLTLPPGIPLWMACIGGLVAVGLGKLPFGGLGQNLFNPALIGRAFLQAAFPGALTSWTSQAGPSSFFHVHPSSLALPFMQAAPDALASATPLGMMKFEHHATAFSDLLLGNTSGSLGETCGLVILICGIVMAIRRVFDWRIPVCILLTVLAVSGAIWAFGQGRYPSPWFMLGSGGLLLGAIYMATDPVTSPMSPRGAWIFGAGVGVLVVLIRLWGGLPEGVMYAILLMNAATPLIDRVSQPRPLGRGRAVA